MTPLKRFVRNFIEKRLQRFYEGPEAPDRLRAMVIDFANLHPNATRGEWVQFASDHAKEAYSSGWMRGYEYVERYDPPYYRPTSPEAIADEEEHGWQWSPNILLEGSSDARVDESPGGEVTEDQRKIEIELGLRPADEEP